MGDYLSAAFDFDLTLRHAFAPIVGRLEPLIGLSLQTRLAFSEYAHPTIVVPGEDNSAVSSLHLGFGLEPIVGLQYAFPLNAIGSRFVTFFEVHPEVMFWPVRSASDQSSGEVAEAPAVIELFEGTGADPTLQVGTSLGVRLEL